MTVYGDAEPEDAWHPDDPVVLLLDNVSRRLTALGHPPRRGDLTINELVADLTWRLGRARRNRTLDRRGRYRVALAGDDLAHCVRRLNRG